jgi:hypothetical protein
LIEKAYISLTSIRFWRFTPKGEKYEPKAKGPHHHRILKNEVFKIDILLCSIGGESSIFKTCKTLLNTKRRILFTGSFVKSKEKRLRQGEKISNLENAFFNLIHVPLTIC